MENNKQSCDGHLRKIIRSGIISVIPNLPTFATTQMMYLHVSKISFGHCGPPQYKNIESPKYRLTYLTPPIMGGIGIHLTGVFTYLYIYVLNDRAIACEQRVGLGIWSG